MNETPDPAENEQPSLLAPRRQQPSGADAPQTAAGQSERPRPPRRQEKSRRPQPSGPAPPRQPRPVRGESGGEVSLKAIALVAFVFGVFLHGCVALSILNDEGTSAEDLRPRVGATATRGPVVTPTATVLPDRTTCEEIRGTDYRSDAERDFFRRNCITGAAPVTGTPSAPGDG